MTNVKVLASPKSWIEGEAVRQLEKVAERPGVIEAIGMPGLHPGKGCPVDAVFTTEGILYPDLVGSDIGCGMGFWGISLRSFKPERIAKKIRGKLEQPFDIDPMVYLAGYRVEPCGFESSLGTIGHGNHFAEILAVDEIRDEVLFQDNLNYRSYLLVHSGSRGYGEKILYEHTAKHQANGVPADSAEASEYLKLHDHAVAWARVNRRVIAARLLSELGAVAGEIHESIHNFVSFEGRTKSGAPLWVHRKGAIPTRDEPFVVIPGSRDSHTYVVAPIGNQSMSHWSVSHGAGRKMSRRDARIKFSSEQGSIKKLERNKFGSVVICEDRDLLMEETGGAYKNIEQVVDDLVSYGLVKVIALLKPVVTYKVARIDQD